MKEWSANAGEDAMKSEIIKITTPFIKLDQLLKFSAVADTGAMAKDMILEGMVKVNGDTCVMRGKKVYPGDVVEIEFDETNVVIKVQS